MKNVTTTINLEELSQQLSIDDISNLILLKSNRSNQQLNTDSDNLKKFNRNYEILKESLESSLKENKKGFIFKLSLSNDFLEKSTNISTILNLLEEENGVKMCFLPLFDLATKHLIEAELLTTNDEINYYKKIVYPTEKLKNLILPLKEENGSYDYDMVNKVLISYLAKTFNNEIIDVNQED